MLDFEDVWLSADEVARFEQVSVRTIQRRVVEGKYITRRAENDNRGTYLIQVASLSWEARQAYLKEQRPAAALPEVLPVEQKESAEDLLLNAWEKAPQKAQDKASMRAAAVAEWLRLQRRHIPVKAATAEIVEKYGIGKSALYAWHTAITGQRDRTLWPMLLLDSSRPEREAPFSESARQYILKQWGTQNRPKLAAIYRRAKDEAGKHAWDLPSYATVARWINTLDAATVQLLRYGSRAVEELYPPQQRNRAAQALHEVWCVDGHKADLFVHDRATDTTFRPVIVGFMDERSRVLVGYAIADSETGLLTRNAFMDAVKKTRTLPEFVRPDNGRAFAGKLMSGGIKNRFRGKVKEEELTGIWTALQIDVIWAQPYSGRSKLIESFWRVIAENVCKRPEFAGAYTGNKPDARPEEWDKNKAADLAIFEAALKEELARYHSNIHRGDGMDGQSPMAVYAELLEHTPQRPAPTAEQMRMLMLCAQAIKLDKHQTIKLFGNRYFTEQLAFLPLRATVDVRFDGNDLSAPVHVYHQGRYVCAAPALGKVGVHDKEAAKAQAAARKRLKKSAQERASALQNLGEVFTPVLSQQRKPEAPETQQTMPAPNVTQIHSRAGLETPPPIDPIAQAQKEEFERMEAEMRRLKMAEWRNGTR